MLPGDGTAHYGEPAVLYRNVLVSLQGRRLKIEKPKDLKGLSIVLRYDLPDIF